MEAAVVLLRWTEYGASFVLAGGALFALYALPADGPSSAGAMGWPRRLFAGSAAVLLLTTLAGLVAQTAVVAGSLSAALDPTTLASVLTEMAMGLSSVTRAAVAAIALAVLVLAPYRRATLAIVVHLGAIVVASMAWMGHGAATDGPGGLPHLAADIVHLLAAAVWIGALACFLGLAATSWRDGAQAPVFHAALAGFSGVGTGVVAALVVTGLINSWFLVGPAGAAALLTTLYGRLLLLKIALFTGMILLAAANRFRLTPALRKALGDPAANGSKVRALRHSLIFELGAGLALLALVAWLGQLAPITAQ